jgi:hypothetical protein
MGSCDGSPWDSSDKETNRGMSRATGAGGDRDAIPHLPPSCIRDSFYRGICYIQPLRSAQRKSRNEGVQVELSQYQLAPWGGRWSKDILVLLHNAILAELRDLNALAHILQRRKFVLSRAHIDMLHAWFDDLRRFACVCRPLRPSWVRVRAHLMCGKGSVNFSQGDNESSSQRQGFGANLQVHC